jgi:hypothetical protein
LREVREARKFRVSQSAVTAQAKLSPKLQEKNYKLVENYMQTENFADVVDH